jgi:hypothetical protein
LKQLIAAARARLAHTMGADEPTGRLAAAWALGVGIGLSPVLGVHTLIALGLAFLFRLNKVDVLLGTLVINPWTFPVYFPFALVLGRWITGVRVHRAALPPIEALLRPDTWREHAPWLRRMLIAWGAGSTILACVGGLVTYGLVRQLLERHRRRLAASGRRPTPTPDA